MVLVLAAFTTPSPSAWGKSAWDKPYSIQLDVELSRSFTGSVEGKVVDVHDDPMTWLVWGAVRHNPWAAKVCLVCTKDYTAAVLLSGPAGGKQLVKNVGDFPLLYGSAKTFSVVFLDEPVGDYEALVLVQDGAGEEVARFTYGFSVVPTASEP